MPPVAPRPQAPIGMLVGGGHLPIEIAHSIIAAGGRVHAVLIDGEADQDWTGIPHTTVNWGGIGGMVAALKGAGCRDLVIIGRVRRPDPRKVRPDLGFFLALPKVLRLITAGGDDSLLRRCLRFFEEHGLTVRGPGEVAPSLVAGAGTLGSIAPPSDAARDIGVGLDVLRALGRFDIGQAVVVANGQLVAVEGAEGTDGLLGRLPAAVRGGVLVKCPKPGQELRIDMPVIGPQTVTLALESGLAGIAVMAGSVLMADRAELLRRADAGGGFVCGVAAAPAAGAVAGSAHRGGVAPSLSPLGAALPGAAEQRDAATAADVVQTVSRFAAQACAFVARNHVLAVGVGEGAASFADRIRALRQWGDRGRGRRRGVIALGDGVRLDGPALRAIAESRIAGITLAQQPADPAPVIVGADSLGLTLLAPTPAGPRTLRALAGQPTRLDAQGTDLSATGPHPTTICIVAGEHSGDLLGGKLMAAVHARLGGAVRWVGVGGEHMAAQGLDTLFPLSDVAVMGPLSILPRLPRIIARVNHTVHAAVRARPDIVVIIDSPEFTHPIAKRIRKRLPDVPILDYVSPSVWAWRPGRAPRMRSYIDHVMALLPFEPQVHRDLGGPPCTYVGHPSIERLDWIRSRDGAALGRRLGLDPARPVLAVLPGSRPSEVGRLMQPFGETVALLKARIPGLQVVLPAVDSVRQLIEERLASWPVRPILLSGEEDKFAAFRLAHAALAASGTVTLELALAGTPMVVAYKVDAVAIRLRFLVKVRSIVLANLVLGENVFPELIQEQAEPGGLADAVAPLLADTPARARQLAALARIPELIRLPSGTPSEVAAAIVLGHLARENGENRHFRAIRHS
jgi:lipid-A-disaccharide synthase